MNALYKLFRDESRLNEDGELKGLCAVNLINPDSYYPNTVDLGYFMPGLISVKPDPDHKDRVIISAYGEIEEHIIKR